MYKLYCGKDAEPIKGERFTMFTSEDNCYFAFSENEPNGYVEVPKELMPSMSELSREWYVLCEKTVVNEHIEKNKKEYGEVLNIFFDKLEEELKAESEN